MTIGNTSANANSGVGADIIGQSFVNDTSGTGTLILLNDWAVVVSEYGVNNPLSSSAILNIYAGTGIGGTLIGSATAYDSSGTLAGNNTAKWTFAGGLSLIDNQTYTAAVISTTLGQLFYIFSTANPYVNGYVTRSVSGDLPSYDTLFQANFSAAATPVPFEFEPTGGLLVLGGGWLLRRHLKKRAKKA